MYFDIRSWHCDMLKNILISTDFYRKFLCHVTLCRSDEKCLKFWKTEMQPHFLYTQHFFLEKDFRTGI